MHINENKEPFLVRKSIKRFEKIDTRTIMVFMVFKIKQCMWKVCKSMEQNLESLGLWLENWIWKVKREENEMNRGYIKGYIFTSPLKESTKR